MAQEHLMNCLYIGIPMGLLITNILLINEFPDMKSDTKTNKNHLVVTFGKKASRWIYLLILGLTAYTTLMLADSVGVKITNTISNISSVWRICFFYSV